MKIAVYAISKNEEQFVKRFCESAADADVIIIADTGSTDNTASVAKSEGAVVYDICITPWRFDKARDAALALVPRDVDVCIALDLDEVLMPGWRQEVERVWQANTTRLHYLFDWSKGVVFYSNKIHSRHGYHWHHPCHEYIRPDLRIQEVYAKTDMLLVKHLPDDSKSRGQYMDLLEMSVKEDPTCPRNAFYYARELTYYGHWEKAEIALQNYLAMPEATWKNERAYAMRLLGLCCKNLNKDSLAWFRKACAEEPNVRDTWLALAEELCNQNKWEECFGAAITALKITEHNYTYTADPKSFSSKPYDLAAIAAYNLGLKKEALNLGLQAVELEPDNQRLINNLAFYKE